MKWIYCQPACKYISCLLKWRWIHTNYIANYILRQCIDICRIHYACFVKQIEQWCYLWITSSVSAFICVFKLPFQTNGIFHTPTCNKVRMVHYICWGATGHNFQSMLYFFLWRSIFSKQKVQTLMKCRVLLCLIVAFPGQTQLLFDHPSYLFWCNVRTFSLCFWIQACFKNTKKHTKKTLRLLIVFAPETFPRCEWQFSSQWMHCMYQIKTFAPWCLS